MHFYIADVFITFDVAFFHGIGALLVRTERNISCKYCTSNSWNIGMPFATHVKNRVSISLANPKNGTRRRKEEAAGLSRSPNEVVSSSGKIPIPIARLWKENQKIPRLQSVRALASVMVSSESSNPSFLLTKLTLTWFSRLDTQTRGTRIPDICQPRKNKITSFSTNTREVELCFEGGREAKREQREGREKREKEGRKKREKEGEKEREEGGQVDMGI